MTTSAGGTLHPYIKKLIDEIGFKTLTEPQKRAIPLILSGKNVLIIAPTGSGKTEAALIPIFSQLISGNYKPIAVVYITPLRALNRDLIDRINWWASRLDIEVAVRHGDTVKKERRRHALKPPEIMITTPETFAMLLNTKIMSKHLSNVKWVIVDEVHELVDSKRGAQLSIALEKLREMTNDFQIIGLSATVGSPEIVGKFLVGANREMEIINIDVTKRMRFQILYPTPTDEDYRLADELYTYPAVAARIRAIINLVNKHRATLIFTNTRPMAEILSSRILLLDENFPVSIHHGSLSANVRMRIERMLKDSRIKGVVCTSSLELGIDIGNIDLVIQYNSPRQVTRLIQRAGRSGHWIERESKGVIIVQDSDDALESIAIVEYAKRNILEKPIVPSKPLDVLSHEIAGYLIANRVVSAKKIYDVIQRSYVYRDLTYDEYKRLLDFLSNLVDRYIIYDESSDLIYRGRIRRLFEYYFENLSMIPEIKQYLVVNEEDGSPIGILDGEFVAEYGEPGFKFIMTGRPWRIVHVYRDRVYVKPDDDPIGAIPYWIGEEIPVPYHIAQRVGEIKRKLEELVRNSVDNPVRVLSSELNVTQDLLRKALEPYVEQLNASLPIPTDRRIVMEKFQDKLIIHVHGGTLINRALAILISQLIFEEFGESVYSSSDPYKIIISTQTVQPNDVERMLLEVTLDNAEKLIRAGIENTPYFRWRLIHVARKMGLISKDVTLDPTKTEQLVLSLRGTPAYDEAYKESIERDRDIRGALNILRRIINGELTIEVIPNKLSPTPLMEHFLKYSSIKLEPTRVDKLKMLKILSIRVRLLNEVVTLACLSCLNYIDEMRVRDLPDDILCPNCGSRKIGVSKELLDDVMRVISIAKVGGRNVEGDSIWKELNQTSKLIEKYGKAAAIVISSGLPINKAKDILSREGRVSGRLFRLILEAEKKSLLEKYQ